MAEQRTIEQTQRQVCSEIETLLGLKPHSLAPDTPLQSLGMDSLRFVSLLVAIEKAFGLNLLKAGLTRESLQSARTLADAIHAGLEHH